MEPVPFENLKDAILQRRGLRSAVPFSRPPLSHPPSSAIDLVYLSLSRGGVALAVGGAHQYSHQPGPQRQNASNRVTYPSKTHGCTSRCTSFGKGASFLLFSYEMIAFTWRLSCLHAPTQVARVRLQGACHQRVSAARGFRNRCHPRSRPLPLAAALRSITGSPRSAHI